MMSLKPFAVDEGASTPTSDPVLQAIPDQDVIDSPKVDLRLERGLDLSLKVGIDRSVFVLMWAHERTLGPAFWPVLTLLHC